MVNKLSELSEIAFKYGSDRCPQNGHFYTEYYSNLLKYRRNDIRSVLEIGIGKGALGLLMWREFFPNAIICGTDTRGSFLVRRTRILSFYCDQTKKEDLASLIGKTGSNIDIVIDNGSKRPEDQISTCLTLMPLLKKKVIYAIEGADPSIQKQLGNYITDILSSKKNPDNIVVVRHKKAKTSIIIPIQKENYSLFPKTVQDIYIKRQPEILR